MTRRRLAPFRRPTLPAWSEARTILHLGIPSGLQTAVISAGSAAIMSVVTSFSAAVVDGFGAAQRIDALIMLPAQALGTSVSSMAGQNIGNGNWGRVGRICRVGVAYNLASMTVVALLVVVLARPAVTMFIREPDAVEFAVSYRLLRL